MIGRVVQMLVSIVVAILVVGIVLVLLEANPANDLVSWIRARASWLAGPLDGMFTFDNARLAIAVNWGIAAVVYSFIGGLIARLLGRTGR